MWSDFDFNEPYNGEFNNVIYGVELPEEYVAFMKAHNGGEGDTGESWLFLFPIEELQEVNDDYHEFLPEGNIIIGSNGGINYRIHTDAIKTNLIPIELTPQQTSVIYASEADVLNMALFGMTAKQWRENYPDKKGNIRDYASINELICLSNMENINAVLIEDGLSQKERLIKLNKIAIHQMSILETQTTTVLK